MSVSRRASGDEADEYTDDVAAGPSHKRGPPKGYILALERRLHQVEALLGTIISSDDPRARGLVNDLSRDQLAAHIVRRVKIGPFGPRGRLQQP